MNIVDLLIPNPGAGIVRQEIAITFHERTATGAVDDDRIEFFQRERIEVLEGEPPRPSRNSPLCPINEPQQTCVRGVKTSQPLASNTSTVSRFTFE